MSETPIYDALLRELPLPSREPQLQSAEKSAGPSVKARAPRGVRTAPAPRKANGSTRPSKADRG